MKISVFGLGYVGTVSAACLAQDGHEVLGVDPIASKVDLINAGLSPIIEANVQEIVAEAVRADRLRVTMDPVKAVQETELSLVCVGTPSQMNGDLDLTYVRRVCQEIGLALTNNTARHTIVVRSTVLPGTMRGIVIPILEEKSKKRAGVDFGVCNNPEFLREGSAVVDYRLPAKTVIGEVDRASGDMAAALYAKLEAPLVRVSLETAEMVKYIDNAWHALKIGFANEIGSLCKSLEVDAKRAMEMLCMDTKLNISPAYLSPGFAFGGSCLPKDLRALNYTAKLRDLDLPILSSILRSNDLQVMRGLQLIMAKEHKRIGILGFSFKEGTDDLRESPMIEIIERLVGKGYDLRIYDKNVQLAKLIGTNKQFVFNRLPHIAALMVDDIEAVLRHGQTIVIGNKDPEFRTVLERLRGSQCMVDLVRIANNKSADKYDCIC
ncbi:MAG: nucleotide sugar dehydrogenase [Bryobacteraceae bacterium]